MAQEPSLSSALRGTKTVARAFFAAVDALPEPQRQAVAQAALAQIRDDMKTQRDKIAAAVIRAKAKAPASSEGRAVRTKTAKAPAKVAKKATPVRRARKPPAAAPAASQPQNGNGVATEA